MKTALTFLFAVLTAVVFSQGIDQYSETDNFIIVRVDPMVSHLETFYKGPDGKPYRNFDGLATDLKTKGKTLVFACNGGMFMEDLRPMGYYQEHRIVISKLNIRSGKTNFYIQPNGVFWCGSDGCAGITPTEQFAGSFHEYATQSGPMLVSDSVINPKFNPASTSLYMRNGVGITKDGMVVFIISKYRVSFYEIAQAFVEQGCVDALFLDGGISDFYYPAGNIPGYGRTLSIMIGVVK